MSNPNDLWHIDCTHCPFTDKNFSVYIDDRIRLITSFGIFKKATVENAIALLKTGILDYGKPKCIMTDHGTQYYAVRKEVKQESIQFRIVLDSLGIKHYLARIGRPQTNDKVERFFLI